MQLKFRKAKVRAMLIQDKDYFGSVNVKIIKFVELNEGEEAKKDKKNPEEPEHAMNRHKSFAAEEFSRRLSGNSVLIFNLLPSTEK